MTFSLTENQFSGKTYSYTIGPCTTAAAGLHAGVCRVLPDQRVVVVLVSVERSRRHRMVKLVIFEFFNCQS